MNCRDRLFRRPPGPVATGSFDPELDEVLVGDLGWLVGLLLDPLEVNLEQLDPGQAPFRDASQRLSDEPFELVDVVVPRVPVLG